MSVLVVAVLGYVFALPVLLWHRRDLRSFRGPLWAGVGSRSSRLRGAVIAYAALGWPEIFVALAWRTGMTRAALTEERENVREAHPAAHI